MLYYKNGRFRMDSVSYELPEGVYIDTEFQSVIATGFEQKNETVEAAPAAATAAAPKGDISEIDEIFSIFNR